MRLIKTGKEIGECLQARKLGNLSAIVPGHANILGFV